MIIEIYVVFIDLKSTKTLIFKEKFLKRFIEAGIAEASAISIAGSLASEGQIPVFM